ncbi:hypothetical protein, no similarity [Maudiozyma saulgeensis]|uniref:SWIRM domain-containing protein n=1 Tax=Maudiozyma saulgeensis TaxID=1789683 RepID=A0A1X7R186_9SACH|nr:hypothetical protein, no similarity [Kazachstania saulgeensis]
MDLFNTEGDESSSHESNALDQLDNNNEFEMNSQEQTPAIENSLNDQERENDENPLLEEKTSPNNNDYNEEEDDDNDNNNTSTTVDHSFVTATAIDTSQDENKSEENDAHLSTDITDYNKEENKHSDNDNNNNNNNNNDDDDDDDEGKNHIENTDSPVSESKDDNTDVDMLKDDNAAGNNEEEIIKDTETTETPISEIDNNNSIMRGEQESNSEIPNEEDNIEKISSTDNNKVEEEKDLDKSDDNGNEKKDTDMNGDEEKDFNVNDDDLDEEEEEDDEQIDDIPEQESDADTETPKIPDYRSHGITDGVTVTTLNQELEEEKNTTTINEDDNTNNNSNDNSLINEVYNADDQEKDNLGLNTGEEDDEEEEEEEEEEADDEETHREKSTDFEGSPSVVINESETTSPVTLTSELNQNTTENQSEYMNRDNKIVTNVSQVDSTSAVQSNTKENETTEPTDEHFNDDKLIAEDNSTEKREENSANVEKSAQEIHDVSPDSNHNHSSPQEHSISKHHTRKVEDGIIIPQTHEIVIPSYSTWFNLRKIHQIEKKSLPEFFTNRIASKTPEIYIKYRNFMVNSYRLNPNEYFSVTAARRNLSGDAASIFRIHKFLMKWGLINYQVSAKQLPKTVEPPYTNEFSTKHDAPRGIFPFESYKPSVQLPDMAKLKKMMDVEDERSTLYKYLSQEKKRTFSELEKNEMQESESINNNETKPATSSTIPLNETRPIKRPNILDNVSVSTEKVKWEREDLKKLLFGIQTYGSDWYKVAKHVGNKTPEQCVLRFLQLPIEDKFLYQDLNKLPGNHTEKGQSSVVSVDDLGPLKFAPHLPFSKSENPVLSTIAFLVGLVDPQIVQQMTNRAIRSMEDDEKENIGEEDNKLNDKMEVYNDDKVEKADETENVDTQIAIKEHPETQTAETPAKIEDESTKTNAEPLSENREEIKPDTVKEDKVEPSSEEGESGAKNTGLTVPSAIPEDVEMIDSTTQQQNSREGSSDNTDALFGDDNSDEDMMADEYKEDETKNIDTTDVVGPSESVIESETLKDNTSLDVTGQNKEEHLENKEEAGTSPEDIVTTKVDTNTNSNDATENQTEKIGEKNEPEVVLDTLVEMRSSTMPVIEKEEPPKETEAEENNDVKEGSEIAISSLGVRSHVFANNEERQMNKLANQMIQIQLEKLETKLKIFDKLERSLEFDKKKLERKQEEFLVQRLTFAKSSNLLVKKFDKALNLLNDNHAESSTSTKNVDESTIKSLTSSVSEMKQLLSRPLYLSFGSKVEGPKMSTTEETDTTEDLENGMKPISIENPQVYRYWSA